MQTCSRRSFLKTLTMAGAASLLPFPFQTCSQKQTRPNIIHILIDDMGYGDLGCYGNSFHETPHIDQLARDGMKFTNAYAAAPNCSPTRASILTGQWPARLGITQYLHGNKNAPRMQNKPMIQPDLPPGLPLETTTIAEAVKEHGYATAAIGKWHLGGEQFLPENHGFDYTFAGGDYGHHQTMFAPFEIPVIPDTEPGTYLTDYLTDKAEAFIESNQDRPFFMYLSLYAVHSPIQAKQHLIEKYQKKLKNGEEGDPVYAAMVEGVDICVERVRQKLADLNLAENTIIMFFSDNGGVPSRASNGPLRSGKGYLYEGGIREPLIVHWPGVTEPGSVNDELVTSTDFYPTIMEMITGASPAGTSDGETIVPLLKGQNEIQRDTLYWHYPHYSNAGSPPCSAIREKNYKLIEFHEDGSLELYDLAADIGETTNLADEMPELTDRLYKKLQAWQNQLDVKMPWPNPDHTPGDGT